MDYRLRSLHRIVLCARRYATPERRLFTADMRYQEYCLDFYIQPPAPDTVLFPTYQTQSDFGVVDKGVPLATMFIWSLSRLAVPCG